MLGALVAFLAQEGWAALQEIGDCRTVGLMADGAVFGNGLVVADERATLLHVAHVAGLVDAALLELFGACGAVRIMTIRTGHLAL
jgi:hypothetical protein